MRCRCSSESNLLPHLSTLSKKKPWRCRASHLAASIRIILPLSNRRLRMVEWQENRGVQSLRWLTRQNKCQDQFSRSRRLWNQHPKREQTNWSYTIRAWMLRTSATLKCYNSIIIARLRLLQIVALPQEAKTSLKRPLRLLSPQCITLSCLFLS